MTLWSWGMSANFYRARVHQITRWAEGSLLRPEGHYPPSTTILRRHRLSFSSREQSG